MIGQVAVPAYTSSIPTLSVIFVCPSIPRDGLWQSDYATDVLRTGLERQAIGRQTTRHVLEPLSSLWIAQSERIA